MATFGSILAFVGMFWLLSFIAASLLCSPALFTQLPRRHRLRLPTADEARVMQQARVAKGGDSKAPRDSAWMYLLLPIFAPMMLVLFVLVLVPAFIAMWLSVVCVNYRYCRRAVYRALRRRHAILSFWWSYPIGLAVFIRKIVGPCATAFARC